ncbi:MAG: class I SAM-dependent methyltransferase [bacterium]|nr:class I SAM-dependent methyltransferase [bacterium]
MRAHLKKVVHEENEFWSKIFDEEIKNNNINHFSSYWWENYYREIAAYVKFKLNKFSNPKVLEAGAGSGKASILLGKKLDRTLLDISDKALDFAKELVNKFNVENIKYVKGDVFDMPFRKDSFHLVWNIGVVEHYNFEESARALAEMVRVTKENGYIAFAVPNFSSGPILKARLLKHTVFKFIPGYRLGTEKQYLESDLIRILNKAVQYSDKYIEDFDVQYFGNPLPMETPKIVLKSFGRLIEKWFPKNRFLIFIIAKLRRKK